MANVKVLLRENVQDLGTLGDIVEVAPGYARNYLLPRRLAVEASSENMRVMERRRARYEAEMAQREEQVAAQIQSIGNLQLVTRQKADES